MPDFASLFTIDDIFLSEPMSQWQHQKFCDTYQFAYDRQDEGQKSCNYQYQVAEESLSDSIQHYSQAQDNHQLHMPQPRLQMKIDSQEYRFACPRQDNRIISMFKEQKTHLNTNLSSPNISRTDLNVTAYFRKSNSMFICLLCHEGFNALVSGQGLLKGLTRHLQSVHDMDMNTQERQGQKRTRKYVKYFGDDRNKSTSHCKVCNQTFRWLNEDRKFEHLVKTHPEMNLKKRRTYVMKKERPKKSIVWQIFFLRKQIGSKPCRNGTGEEVVCRICGVVYPRKENYATWDMLTHFKKEHSQIYEFVTERDSPPSTVNYRIFNETAIQTDNNQHNQIHAQNKQTPEMLPQRQLCWQIYEIDQKQNSVVCMACRQSWQYRALVHDQILIHHLSVVHPQIEWVLNKLNKEGLFDLRDHINREDQVRTKIISNRSIKANNKSSND